MREDLISVIVPIYNGSKVIEKCLHSIINQTYKNIEVIVIDDGSQDNTVELVEDIIEKDSRVNLLKQANAGPSVARNRGIDASKGRYIFFVDGDDFLDLELFEILISNYQKGKLNGVNYRLITEKGSKLSKRESCSNKNMFFNIVNGKIGGYIWGYLYEYNIVKNIKFDTNAHYIEDMLFLVSYCEFVDGIFYHDDVFYNYLMFSTSITNSSFNVLKKIKDINYIIDTIKIKKNIRKMVNDNNYFTKKKVRLIDSEIAKLRKYKEMKEIIQNEDFAIIVKQIVEESRSKICIFYCAFICKIPFVMYIYTKLRLSIKTIKRV
ncbi:MAG: glycosyltransferase [Lachnospiraceae bacterium]|nr:glycosyltransferase [Lachnospiraceae bacterium]